MNDSRQSILMVEDDEHIAYILRFLLERNGFAVEQAADGRQALARLAQPPPDLDGCDGHHREQNVHWTSIREAHE